MPKTQKIIDYNMKKNFKNIKAGCQRFEKISSYTDNYIHKNKPRYDKVFKNVKRFMDARELANVL